MKSREPQRNKIIQFDGDCILCSYTIIRIIKADKREKFLYQTIINNEQNRTIDSVILIDGDKKYYYSEAILKIAKELGGIYYLLLLGKIIPTPLRNKIYFWIARNRYKWFGKRKTCFLPEEKHKNRFI